MVTRGARAAALCAAAFSCVRFAGAQPEGPGAEVLRYVRVSAPRVVLEHVTLIDGTGANPRRDQNLSIEAGRIAAIAPGEDVQGSDGATILDLRGYAVIPGIVGMHEHLWYLGRPNLAPDDSYDPPGISLEMSFSAPRLYLANGVTTIRTAGSIAPYTDVRLQQAIEDRTIPGPHLDVTGPYLTGPGIANLQFPALTGPDDARRTVAFWADRGVTSFKAYTQITRDELKAAVDEAHRRGLKITGHLCSVTYDEAIEAGIDNLEHGFSSNTALDSGKKPGTCTASGGDETLEQMVPGSPAANQLIASLVAHNVAITSTMPGRAASLRQTPPRPEVLDAMAPAARDAFQRASSRPPDASTRAKIERLLRREMDLERAFVAAGGLLMAGADPVGLNGLLPGFGDQREIELLVDAGFTPLQAIRIATLNGAGFLGRADRIGSIAVGKNADLVVVKGDPSAHIADIEQVEIVFKDGLGYDPKRLLASVKGHYGEY